jgi:hypothetical protein
MDWRLTPGARGASSSCVRVALILASPRAVANPWLAPAAPSPRTWFCRSRWEYRPVYHDDRVNTRLTRFLTSSELCCRQSEKFVATHGRTGFPSLRFPTVPKNCPGMKGPPEPRRTAGHGPGRPPRTPGRPCPRHGRKWRCLTRSVAPASPGRRTDIAKVRRDVAPAGVADPAPTQVSAWRLGLQRLHARGHGRRRCLLRDGARARACVAGRARPAVRGRVLAQRVT